MAFKAIYKIERENSKANMILKAKFDFSKDIENPHNYFFKSMSPHAKDIAKRIRESSENNSLHRYLLNQEKYEYSITNSSCSYNDYKKVDKRLRTHGYKKDGFQLTVWVDKILMKHLGEFNLEVIDLQELNNTIITGKFYPLIKPII